MNDERGEVDQFLLKHIDTVPHLEALLLLWGGRDQSWTITAMASRLFVAETTAREILNDLVIHDLAVVYRQEIYGYNAEDERDRLMVAVESMYRKELIRVSRLIHSRPSAAIRAFAQAFRVKKDRE